MTMTTLINGTTSYKSARIVISAMSWALPASGQIGQLSAMVPGDSEGATEVYVNLRQGRSRIVVEDDDLGLWEGIIEKISRRLDGGFDLECRHLVSALGAELVGEGAFTGLTAGTLAFEAYRRAFSGQGSPSVLPGAFAEAPPELLTYDYGGRTLLDVLKDLADQTGQEWRITGGRLYWGPPQGTHYVCYLAEDGDFIVTTPPATDSTNLLKAVTARAASGGSYTATAPENANLPGALHKPVTVQGDDQTAAAMQRTAEQTLALGRVPVMTMAIALRRNRLESAILGTGYTISGTNFLPRWLPTPATATVITGTLPAVPHGANVREGDTLTLCLAGKAGVGMVSRWRVLTRSWDASAPDLIPLTLQYQAPLIQETLSAYVTRPVQPVVEPEGRNLRRQLLNLNAAVRRMQAAG